MKRSWIWWVAAYVVTVMAGFLFHWLYDWSPNLLFSVLSPVRESIWEHLKILFWPMLFTGWGLTAKTELHRGNWYFATLLAAVLLLIFGWVIHIQMGTEEVLLDILGLMVIELIAFAAAAWFEIGERWRGILLVGILVLGALIISFTFWQPTGMMFADLSRTETMYSFC